jgi:hypothetical protein
LVAVKLRESIRSRTQEAAKVSGDKGHTTHADATHLLAITSRSQLGRVIQCPPGPNQNQVDGRDFVPFARKILGLPPMRVFGPGMKLDGWDHEIEVCNCPHPKRGDDACLLDANGDHAAGCASGRSARTRTHNLVLWAIASIFKRWGMTTQTEPPTHTLLLDRWTELVTRAVFAKKQTASARETSARTLKLIQMLGPDSVATKAQKTLASLEYATILEAAEDQPGLRIDLRIVGYDCSERWIDVSGVHTTAQTHRDGTYAAMMADKPEAAGDPRKGAHLPCTPALLDRQTQKSNKYASLVATAHMQYDKGERPSGKPVFLPVIFSNDGELAPKAFMLIEYGAMQVKANAARFPSRDNAKPSEVAARFRAELKDAIMCAIAKGTGLMMRTGGFPMGSRFPKGHDGRVGVYGQGRRGCAATVADSGGGGCGGGGGGGGEMGEAGGSASFA